MVIRNKVQEFYSVRRQLPTLSNLHQTLKWEISYPVSKELLCRTLLTLGFSWKRMGNNREVLKEKPYVVAHWLSFYQKKQNWKRKDFSLCTWMRHASTLPILPRDAGRVPMNLAFYHFVTEVSGSSWFMRNPNKALLEEHSLYTKHLAVPETTTRRWMGIISRSGSKRCFSPTLVNNSRFTLKHFHINM